jgi:hypothetical protein
VLLKDQDKTKKVIAGLDNDRRKVNRAMKELFAMEVAYGCAGSAEDCMACE